MLATFLNKSISQKCIGNFCLIILGVLLAHNSYLLCQIDQFSDANTDQ